MQKTVSGENIAKRKRTDASSFNKQSPQIPHQNKQQNTLTDSDN